MTLSSLVALAISFALSFAASSSGAVFRPGAWYEGLQKPSFTPPNWMFPVVWTILFSLMAIAAFLVWEARGLAAWPQLAFYGVHLLINAGWSYLFFGRRRLDWAMAEVLLLWTSIAILIALFAPISAVAAWLLAPYLAWVTIAAALNFRLLRMNGPRGENAAA